MINLDSGIVYICDVTNIAENGKKPQYALTKIARLWYADRAIGYGRQYAAMGVNAQVDMLIRTKYTAKIRIGRYAMLGNGDQFRITNISPVYDDDTHLRGMDVSLTRLDNKYEVAVIVPVLGGEPGSALQTEDGALMAVGDWTKVR